MTRRMKGGFILPLSVLLVIILTISGTAFMQHDYLERRMATDNIDNHGAFCLANCGIERARETFKINTEGVPSWTLVLNDASLADPAPVYCATCLCGSDSSKKCIVAPFQTPAKNPSISVTGEPIVSDGDPSTLSDIPFSSPGLFDDGEYSVRAFNDNAPGETGSGDANGILVIRALGTIRGEQKLIEATVQAVSAGNLINCATGVNCPNKISGNTNNGKCDETTNPTCDAMDGREPDNGPVPLLDKQDKGFYPLTDSQNYYRDENGSKIATNLKDLVDSHLVVNPTGPGNQPIDLDPADRTYYFATGDVNLQHVTASNVVIFSTGSITIGGDVNITNAIVIALDGITLQSGPTLSAPLFKADGSLFPNYPLMISGTTIDQGGNQKNGSFTGNVYAVGKVTLNPNYFEGAVFGSEVDVKGNTTYTDQKNLRYYEFMPGFFYPDELKTTVIVPGGNSWREIQ